MDIYEKNHIYINIRFDTIVISGIHLVEGHLEHVLPWKRRGRGLLNSVSYHCKDYCCKGVYARKERGDKGPGNLGSWISRMSLHALNHLQGQVLPLPVWRFKCKTDLHNIQSGMVLILTKIRYRAGNFPKEKNSYFPTFWTKPAHITLEDKSVHSWDFFAPSFTWPC